MSPNQRRSITAFAAFSLALAPLSAAVAVSFSPHLIGDFDPTNGNSNVNNINGSKIAIGNTLYFRMTDGGSNNINHGLELWKTDGTAAGTMMIKDIRTGAPNGFPINFGVLNGKLMFNATTGTTQDGATGAELWTSDGTEAGSTLVKDINPGINSSNPATVVQSGNVGFFVASEPTDLDELWKTDGTAAGTVLVKDIHPNVAGIGNSGSNPTGLTPISGGRVVFAADDAFTPNSPGSSVGTFNRSAYVSDGTEAGTFRLADINGPLGNAAPVGFAKLSNDNVLFTALGAGFGSELWRTDGTSAGTYLVKDINTTVNGSGVNQPSSPANVTPIGGGSALFVATDGVSGRELYRTDGTASGTTLVKDINPAGDSAPSTLVNLKGKTYFSASDGVHGRELWVSDGTADGTSMFKEFIDGTGQGAPISLTVVGDYLFFATIAPIAGSSNVTGLLWQTDGTIDGTQIVAQTPGPANGYGFYDLYAVGNTLYYVGANGLDTNGVSANYELFAITVPEPTSMASLGAATLLLRRRRR